MHIARSALAILFFSLGLFGQVYAQSPNSYTWICTVEYTLTGQPNPEEVGQISDQINTALAKRKNKRLSIPCDSEDVHNFYFDIAYQDQTNSTLLSPYAGLLEELKQTNRIEITDDSDPIVLDQPIDNLILHFISCLFSCQPEQDLSHIR